MKKKIFLFIILLISVLQITSCKKDIKDEVKKEFRYALTEGVDSTGNIYYTDEYFNDSSLKYNDSLSTASFCLCLSTFSTNEFKNSLDYTDRSKNALKLLKDLKFSEVEDNASFKVKPSENSIGLVFGLKKIKDYTLVAISSRSQGYQEEWAGNFAIGSGIDDPRHAGFLRASTLFLNDLNEYLTNKSVNGHIKIWAVGFSRGAAVSSMAMAEIDKKLYLNQKVFDTNVNLTKEDIYSYNFEPPCGANFSENINPRSELYQNIKNIVNPNDPVPMLPTILFNFTRYGEDIYLIQKGLDKNYNTDYSKVKDMFFTISKNNKFLLDDFVPLGLSFGNGKLIGEDDTKINYTAGAFLNEMIPSIMEAFESRDNYYSSIEPSLRILFHAIYNHSTLKLSLYNLGLSFATSLVTEGDPDYIISTLQHNPKFVIKELMVYVKQALYSQGITDLSKESFIGFEKFTLGLVGAFAKNFELVFSLFSVDNIRALACSHKPDYMFAYLMAYDTNYISDPITYRSNGEYLSFKLNSYSDVYVLDENGNKIASYENGKVERLSDFTYGLSKGNFFIYLPKGKYTVYSKSDDFDIKYNSVDLLNPIKIESSVEIENDYYKITF